MRKSYLRIAGVTVLVAGGAFACYLVWLANASQRSVTDIEHIKDQQTPQAVLQKRQKALNSNDLATYTECHDFGFPHARELVQLSFEMARGYYEFEDQLIKAYGPDAVEKYRSLDVEAGATISFPSRLEQWSEKDQIKVEGDKASVRWPGSHQTLFLIRKKNIWFVDYGPEVRDLEEAEGMIEFLTTIRDAPRNVMGEIGKPGVSLRDIKKKLLEQFIHRKK